MRDGGECDMHRQGIDVGQRRMSAWRTIPCGCVDQCECCDVFDYRRRGEEAVK